MNAVASPPMRAAALLLIGALAASLLALMPAESAAANESTLTIKPAIERDEAVRNGRYVVVSGTAPAGQISMASLQALDADDKLIGGQNVPPDVRNAAAGDQFLHNDGGTVSGRLFLDHRFSAPPAGLGARSVRLTISVGTAAPTSNVLRVDYTSPEVRRYELTKPDEITVVFTESVYHPQGPDFLNPLDWHITDPITQQRIPPIALRQPPGPDCEEPLPDDRMRDEGCTRILTLATPMDEDATPHVIYRPDFRAQYVDYASNVVLVASATPAWSNAFDRIRPPTPRIEAVNGQSPDSHGRTTGDTRSPTVTVSNLRAGHTVHLTANGDPAGGGTAEGSSHTFTLESLSSDADDFRLRAVVEDPAGNTSNDGLYAARSDAAPSAVDYCVGAVCEINLPRPDVRVPEDELHTNDPAQTISGILLGEAPFAGTAVELRDVLTGRTLATTTAGQDGTWAFARDLDLDRRYRFEVLTRDGERTHGVRVPDIILDRAAPTLQVLRPAPDPSVLPDTRSRHHVEDAIEVEWLAADPAPLALDLENPGLDSVDNGAHVDIDLVFADGQRREVTRALPYTSLTQSFHYLVGPEDVAGAAREAAFEVTVTDMAGNRVTASSHPIVLDGTLSQLVKYQRWLVQNDAGENVVQARFPAALQGTTRPADWRIGGVPVRSATASTEGGGTVVTLVPSQAITDPNARPMVQYAPVPLDPTRLRGADGREIDTSNQRALDKIPPALSISAPDPGPRSAEAVTVTGQTDSTEDPNTVRAYRDGRPVAQVIAGNDGQFSLHVPLEPDRLNQVTVTAVDPSSNLSPTRAFEVIEDSTPPVVVINHPSADSPASRRLDIDWTTIDNNPDVVDIDYRVGSGQWQSLVAGAPDDGRHRWNIPTSIPDDAFLSLRITATDKPGHRGHASVVRGFSPSLQTRAMMAERCDPAPTAPFADRERIPEVHRANVDCLYALGITKGVQRDGQLWFLPHDDISRAQFAGFVYRSVQLLGVELPGPAARFEDVPAGHTFDADIHQLASAKIVEGYDNRRFGPLDPIKRDQTASLLLRTWEHTREETLQAQDSGYFADTRDSFHQRNIDAAYEAGLVEGRVAPRPGQPGTYEPGSSTSRAQMATVLVRYLRQFDA